MESAWPLLMFLFVLMGCGVLILVSGIQSREKELNSVAETARMPVEAPAQSPVGAPDAALESSDEIDLLRSLEQQVRRQAELMARFVACPSINSLHEDDTEKEVEPSLFCRVQKYLELERQLVGEFVSDPTLARLHGRRSMAV